MLNYAILNEAWGSKKKQAIKNVQPVIQDVKEPLVIRISDENIIENLKIYKEDYKQTLIINVLKNYFENNKEESKEPEQEPEPEPRIEYMANYNVDMSDDVKEVIYIMSVLIFVLYLTNKICGNFVKV